MSSRLLHQQRWILPLAAVLLLIAQLSFATHSLHLKASPGDATCSFCIAGSHLGTAPPAPVVVAPTTHVADSPCPVSHVCETLFLVSPRSSRGPPLI